MDYTNVLDEGVGWLQRRLKKYGFSDCLSPLFVFNFWCGFLIFVVRLHCYYQKHIYDLLFSSILCPILSQHAFLFSLPLVNIPLYTVKSHVKVLGLYNSIRVLGGLISEEVTSGGHLK